MTSQRIWSKVVVASADGSPVVTVFALPTPAPAAPAEVEEVRDMAWTPDGRQLLVVVRLYCVAGSVPGAPRSRVLLVDADSTDQDHTSALELLNLPAEIVPHSYNWAPDGHWVAFLTLSQTGSGGTNYLALCALDTSGAGAASGFRYVADLGRQSGATGLLPIAPASWSPNRDGRLTYVAPTPKFTVSNPLGLPTTAGGDPALFLATPTAAGLTAEEGQRLGSATGLIAPVWPEVDATGQPDLLALARTGQTAKSLAIRSIDPTTGAVANLDAVLPSGVGGAGTVSARWDLPHSRLLVLAPHDNSNSVLLDFWLVQLAGRTGAGR